MKNTNNAVNDIARANVLRQEIAACKAAHGHLPQAQQFINATRVRVREEELASLVFNVQVTVEDDKKVSAPSIEAKPAQVSALSYTAADETGVVTKNEVTRNAPCPCGSGKKYKRCHGAS